MSDLPFSPEEIIKDQIFSVSAITEIIKTILEGTFSHITLEGEISNYRPSSTGHLYFSLKDENAMISAVFFKGKSRYLSFIPKDGMKVKVSGTISVYAQRGSYQIIIDFMEQAGMGDILQVLEERKKRLAAEGLFDSERKKEVPDYPQTVGIVTSPTGAALRDILQIARRRNNTINTIIFPCSVQGSDAAEAIARQIECANNYQLVDVLIIGRGGGSLEDLLPFSEECVVRAVVASRIPIVSAVGHEIDTSLCDYAADIRAPTPSAAAELVFPQKNEILAVLQFAVEDFELSIQTRIERLKLMVKSFSADAMELRFRSIEQPLLQRFDDAKENLLLSLNDRVLCLKQKLALAVQKLEGANPAAILERGFSVVRSTTTGKIIRQATQVTIGDELEIMPSTGKIRAKVSASN